MTDYMCEECEHPCKIIIEKGKIDYLDLCIVNGELGVAKFRRIK